MAEEIIRNDKGSIHNNKRCISDDQSNKVDAHLYFSQYASRGISGVIFPLNDVHNDDVCPFLAGQLS